MTHREERQLRADVDRIATPLAMLALVWLLTQPQPANVPGFAHSKAQRSP